MMVPSMHYFRISYSWLISNFWPLLGMCLCAAYPYLGTLYMQQRCGEMVRDKEQSLLFHDTGLGHTLSLLLLPSFLSPFPRSS